jgi:ATP-dependent Lon protease
MIMKEKELLQLQRKIQEQIEEKITTQQREFFLKEQLKAIRAELGMELDEKSQDAARFRRSWPRSPSRRRPAKKLEAELEKLAITDKHSPE